MQRVQPSRGWGRKLSLKMWHVAQQCLEIVSVPTLLSNGARKRSQGSKDCVMWGTKIEMY